MGFLTQRDIATLFLDGSTLVLTLIIMILSKTFRKDEQEDTRYFFIMLITNCILAVGDIFACVFESKTLPGSGILRMAGMTVFHCGIMAISMLWIRYCFIRFKNRGLSFKIGFKKDLIPGIIILALLAVNIFTGWLFYFDESGTFKTGMIYIVFHLVALAYIAVGFSYFVNYKGKATGKTLIPLPLFIFLAAVGIVFTFFIGSSASFVPICIAMALTFTHIGTLNEVLTFKYKTSER